MEMDALSSMAAMMSSPGAAQSGPARLGRSGGATPLFSGSSFQLPLGPGLGAHVAWFSGGRGNAVWATGGFGWGDVEVQDDREALRTSTARMMTGAAGGSYQIRATGTGGVRLKAEGWAGRVLVDGGARIDSATRGSGLSVRLMPSYGDAASGVNELWDRGVSDAVHEPGLQRRAHLDGEVAYGLPGFRGTPFGGFRLGATGTRAFSSGVRYDLGAGLGLRIEGTRREGAFGAAEHTVGVRGRVQLR